MSSPKKRASATPKNPETKSSKLIALLRRDGGASLAEITSTTGWLSHTARARLTDLRKRGLVIDKAKAEGGTRYFIKTEPAA